MSETEADWVAQLAKLAELHQQGALTQDEYLAAKGRIMGVEAGPSTPEEEMAALQHQAEEGYRYQLIRRNRMHSVLLALVFLLLVAVFPFLMGWW